MVGYTNLAHLVGGTGVYAVGHGQRKEEVPESFVKNKADITEIQISEHIKFE